MAFAEYLSQRGPLELEVTTLQNEPQPLPLQCQWLHKMFNTVYFNCILFIPTVDLQNGEKIEKEVVNGPPFWNFDNYFTSIWVQIFTASLLKQ